MNGSAVSVTAVTIDRGNRRLLDSVSIEARRGEVTGIVGPNGAGKSTLLRIIAGDLSPDSGDVTVVGLNPQTTSQQQLARVRAYVGPQTVSEVAFPVGDVVAMGRYPYRSDGPLAETDGEIVAAAMERVDTAHLADRPMRTLSSGEQQRVTIARALAQDTPVILLDEPTSALDIGHQEMVMRIMSELADDGFAVVTVLHDLNLAAAHTGRLLLLVAGSVAAHGSAREVLTPDRLTEAYGQPMAVIDHPFRDCPLVLTTESG